MCKNRCHPSSLKLRFDSVDGKIRSLTWFNAPEGVSIMLTPAPGELVAEIEGHKLTGTVPSEKALRAIAKDYRIADPLARRTLKKKKR